MNEIWKEIPGYEGYFEVSNLGNFRSMDRMVKYKNNGLRKYPGKPLKVEQMQDGYQRIVLMKESIKKLREFGRLAGNEMFFKRAKSIEKRLEKIEVLEKRVEKKLPIKINSCSKAGKDILIIKNLNKNYGESIIFNNFNMEVYGGEKVQLKGKNGSGKSTLIKIILGKDNDFSGEIKINPSVKIGYIPQEIKFNNESDTILEYFLENHGGSETEA